MSKNMFKGKKFDFIGGVVTKKEAVTTQRLSEKSAYFKTMLGMGIKRGTHTQFLNLEYIHEENPTTFGIFGEDGKVFQVKIEDTASVETIAKASNLAKITVDLETDFEKKKEYLEAIYKVKNHERKLEEFKQKEQLTEEDEKEITELQNKIAEYNKEIEEKAVNRKVFCHMKDVIAFLNANLEKIKNLKLRVKGDVKCNYFNGKNRLNYDPKVIEVVPDTYEEQLKVYMEVFYEKDSIEDDKKAQRMIINGYVGERKKKKDTLYPTTVVLDYTNADMNNEEHVAYIEYMKGCFDILNRKQVHKTYVEMDVHNGAEVVEFTEECLTDRQKLAIRFGKAKLEDFKPKGNTYGDRVQELRVISPILKEEYVNGTMEAFCVDDLGEYLPCDDSNISKNNVTETVPETKDEAPSQDEASAKAKLQALFGGK